MRNLIHKTTMAALLAGIVCLSGCSEAEMPYVTETEVTAAKAALTASALSNDSHGTDGRSSATISKTTAETSTSYQVEQPSFTDRDLSGEADVSAAVKITLNGQSASADSDAVSISGSDITITKAGTYLLSGQLYDGTVIVNADKDDKVQLVLSGASVNSQNYAAIYVISADKVFITLADGTSNELSNGGTFQTRDENNVDAVIFSKDDITLNGSGALIISSPGGHGIVGKDDITITGGSYEITSAKTAIKAKDHLEIAGGQFTLKAGTDGLHAENNDDDTLGAIYIAGGSFAIQAGDDGIHATTSLTVDGGSFTITAAEGMEATYIIINDGTISITASDDGINAARKSNICTPTVEINGGSTTIVMGAGDTDGIDANGNIVINGGNVNVTCNSAFDFDGTGTINGGTVIANGQQLTALTNQMMGGHGGMGGRGEKPGAWGGQEEISGNRSEMPGTFGKGSRG